MVNTTKKTERDIYGEILRRQQERDAEAGRRRVMYERNMPSMIAELFSVAGESYRAAEDLAALEANQLEVNSEGEIVVVDENDNRRPLTEYINQRTGAVIFRDAEGMPDKLDAACSSIASALDREQRFFVRAMAALAPYLDRSR